VTPSNGGTTDPNANRKPDSMMDLPPGLTLASLQKLLASNGKVGMKELASIELAIDLIVKQGCSVPDAETKFTSLPVAPSSVVSLDEIAVIPG